METTLYYTFSTVAQTLAGAIGLLAAFVIYYLAQLDGKLRTHLEVLYLRYPNVTETLDLEFLWTQYDIPGLLKYFGEDKLEQLSRGDGLDKAQYLGPAGKLYQKRQLLVGRMRIGLWWTGATILASVATLSIAGIIAESYGALGVLLLALAVAAVGICLFLYGRIVVAAIRL
jgi:hypothetical protein